MAESTYEELTTDPAAGSGDREYVSKRGRRILMALIIILIIILMVASFLALQLLRPPAVATQEELGGVTWVRSIYGYGPDVSQMNEPASVAVAPGGEGLWVSDQIRQRVIKYDPSGQLIEVFQGDPADEEILALPAKIAAAPDGWLYVAEPTYNRVRAYDENGQTQYTLDIPSPMSVAANDEMFIVGAMSGFAAYSRDGELIGIVGTRGKGEDQFDAVNGVALDEDNNAYIVDTFNNRISKYDAEGFLVWRVNTGPPGNEAEGGQMSADQIEEEFKDEYPALMQVPMGATIDGANRLIVADLLDFSIAAFDTEDGSFIGKWGTWGSEDGKFMYAGDICYDPVHDWFVVADSGNQRAQIIRLPDSGGDALSGMRRLLSGPLRACGLPLLLIIIMLIAWVVIRNRRKKNEISAAEATGADSVPTSAGEV